MKTITSSVKLSLLLAILFSFSKLAWAQHSHHHTHTHEHEKCGTDLWVAWKKMQDPGYAVQLELLTKKLTKNKNSYLKGNAIDGYRIPVVFHVIGNTTNVLDEFPITRIIDQLNQLNDQFYHNTHVTQKNEK